jgi:hypothetical protein
MPEQQFEYDVFLSHSSADKAAVRELAQRLKGDGLRVWLDEWVIQPGDLVPLKIEQGLESSRTLVLVMSQAAFDSEWVTLERHTALFRDPTNQQRRFIPLRLDDTEIPDALQQYAYVDWRDGDDGQLARLVATCAQDDTETKDGNTVGCSREQPARETLQGHEGQVWWVVLSHDSSLGVSGSSDRTIRLWDTKTCKCVGVLSGHDSSVNGIALTSSPTRLVTGSWDQTVRVWDIPVVDA